MITRRKVLSTAGLAALAAGVATGLDTGLAATGHPPATASDPPLKRKIPSSGEAVPVIGMGTSRTFDVGPDPVARQPLAEVLRAFFAGGGTVIDSSPMYGAAESVTGELLAALRPATVFVATKVWADGRDAGLAQMEESARQMGVPRLDLMQVHNLRDWRVHLPQLRALKESGRFRYIGVTTSTERQYAELADILRREPLDFVQVNYSLGEREAEQILLPLAAERGVATMINRPFMRSTLFQRTAGKPLPGWAAEIGCDSWSQVFLKWIVAHPAVTCVIPATANPANMASNMRAGFGALPDERLRARIARDVLG